MVQEVVRQIYVAKAVCWSGKPRHRILDHFSNEALSISTSYLDVRFSPVAMYLPKPSKLAFFQLFQ